MDQITALAKISESCSQSIINNCTNNHLTGIAWWVDKNGDNHEYWHGSYDQSSTEHKQGCYCSLEGDGCSHENLKVFSEFTLFRN